MAGNFFLVIFANILHIIHIKRSISQGFWGVKYKANYIAKSTSVKVSNFI
jgi:hypothetical protein